MIVVDAPKKASSSSTREYQIAVSTEPKGRKRYNKKFK